MAEFTIFYSWQSDAPKEINWKFIEKALKKAVEKIKQQNKLPDIPVVDLGMERVPGSPEIATIMFRKIGRSAIFVGDVSLVGEIKSNPSKKIPNANVSVEMGYAAACLGWERIICVLNEHYGKAEEQPVDTRNRRFPINYALRPSQDNKTEVFEGLVNDLYRAIHAVYIHDLESAKEAIRLLDLNCMHLISEAGKKDYFSVPNPHQSTIGSHLDSAKVNAAVTRTLDLGLIWTDTAPDQGKYAYHWTYKGKKVLELLGFRAKPASAKA